MMPDGMIRVTLTYVALVSLLIGFAVGFAAYDLTHPSNCGGFSFEIGPQHSPPPPPPEKERL